jgi:hypothetical protein
VTEDPELLSNGLTSSVGRDEGEEGRVRQPRRCLSVGFEDGRRAPEPRDAGLLEAGKGDQVLWLSPVTPATWETELEDFS